MRNKFLVVILSILVVSGLIAQSPVGFSVVKISSQLWISGTNRTSFFGFLNGTNQVTSSGIADGSIDEDKITTGAVQTTHIEDGTIAWADIGAAVKDSVRVGYDAGLDDGDVTTPKIADYAVTGIKIFDGVVTSAKITDNTIAWDDLSGTVQSAISSGGSLTEGSVTTFHLQDETIDAADIATEALVNRHFAPGEIEGSHIQANTISITNLNAALKDSIRLGYENSSIPLDNSVTSAKIVNGTIQTVDISEAAIISTLIDDDQVDSRHIVDYSLTGADIDTATVMWLNLSTAVQDSIKNLDLSRIYLNRSGADSAGVIYLDSIPYFHNYSISTDDNYRGSNVFIGTNAGNFTLEMDEDESFPSLIGIGHSALKSTTIAATNIAIGRRALEFATVNYGNVAVGNGALRDVTGSGHTWNVGIGDFSGTDLATGEQNTFIGYSAGESIVTGDNNIAVGAFVTLPDGTNNAINIGNVFYSFADGDSVGIGTATPADLFHMEFATNKDVRAGLGSDGSTYTTLRSPDGSLWYITVNNSGVISASATKP